MTVTYTEAKLDPMNFVLFYDMGAITTFDPENNVSILSVQCLTILKA